MAREKTVSPSFKKVFIAASIGAVATLSLYLADLRKDEPNDIESALRGGTPGDVVRPPVSKTPKHDAQLSNVPLDPSLKEMENNWLSTFATARKH